MTFAALAHGQASPGLAIDQQINSRLASMAATSLGTENTRGTTLVIQIQQANGRSVSKLAYVRLSGTHTMPRTVRDTFDTKNARFTSLVPGDYIVEVEAEGFERGRQDVNIFREGGVARCYVVLKPAGIEDSATPHRAVAPLLPPKPRKELEAAISGLRARQPEEAWKHIDWTLKHVPDHPDVHYVAALYYLNGKRDEASARLQLDTAVKLLPDHVQARMSLGELLLSQNKAEESIPHLERLVTVDPDSWRAHYLLSEAFLMANRDPSAAKFHATRALALGNEKAEPAKRALASAEARLTAPTTAEATETVVIAPPELTASAPLPPSLLARWPKDIDQTVPAVTDASGCSLPDVLEGAGHRATEFAEALEHFSAKESIEQEDIDATGVPRRSGQKSYDYSAMVERYGKDLFSIVEMRNGSYGSPRDLTIPVTAKGVNAIGVVFNANYQQDFRFTCEGLGNWHGQPAWQVRFEQRDDRPSRIYQWVVNKQNHPAMLKGRVWISTGSFHILRVEADLIKPIEAIRLDTHHMAIEYAAVKSNSGKYELWLPSSAEVHSRFRGHLIRERHDFSDFVLFSVDTVQNIAAPTDPKP